MEGNEIKKGGKRPGAGRKKGVKVGPYNASGKMLTATTAFRVSEETKKRVKGLQAATKGHKDTFNRMFEEWVEEMAGYYGIE